MTTTTTPSAITPQLKVTMLKHLVAGKDLEFVATVTRVPRDDVLGVVSAHGYPDVKKMEWAVDILTKTVGKIPERPADLSHRPRVLLDPVRPATLIKDLEAERRNSLSMTPPPTISPMTAATADLLSQGRHSPFIRTQNIAAKIHTLLADLTARLADEQAAAEAKAQADRETARIASRIATLQAEIDKLKRKPARPATARATAAPVITGEHPCTTPGCDRTFPTIQGAVTHRRRAHEGFNPHAKAS